ncbi:alcohol dehydrogenase YqhD [Streptomyces acidiscabies]|nr:alcohol dehydrogenase YqhD [Streptomyces acidiscabies]
MKLGGAAVSSGSTAANPTNTPWNLSPRRPTQVVHGIGGLAKWLSHQKGRTLTLLADPAVAESETVDRIIACAAWADRAVELYVPDGPGTLESVTELAERLRGSELVVAIGGGTLLDQAKLAVLISAAPVVRDRLAARGRSGLVLLPAEAEPAVPVVTVPTTVGTGSELSGGACLAGPQGKRLVLGGGLQPDVAVLDPVATRTLPVELLAEGVFEVFFRVAGMYVGDPQDLPTEDAFTLTLLRRMTELGAELASVRRAGLKPGDALRLEIAKLSGVSHGPWFNAGRDPSACKGWYLANELSTGLGLRKMTAAAAVLPPLWRRIAEGDVHWGSARRLRRLWQAVTSAHSPALPEDPVEGIAALLDAWLIGRDIEASEERTELIARSTLRAWGDGLPTLGALTLTDVRRVLTEAVHRLPAAEAVHRLPAAGAVCQAPAAEAVHRPSTAGAVRQTPAAEGVHRPSTAGAVCQAPAAEAVHRLPAAGAVCQAPAAEAVHRPSTAGAVRQTPAAEGVHRLPAAGAVCQAPAAEAVHRPSTAGAVRQTPAAEGVHRLPTAGAVRQAPAAEAVHRLPTAEPVHRPSTAGAVCQTPAAEPVHRPSTAGAVCQAPAAEAVHRLSTAGAVCQTPAAEGVHRLSTAGAVRQTPAVEAVQRPLAAEAVRQTSTAAALHRPPTD